MNKKPIGKWMKIYVDFKLKYGLGEAQVSFFKQLIHFEILTLFMLVVGEYFPALKPMIITIIVPLALVIIIGSYILGYILDKWLKMQDAQNQWSNVRNPEIQDIMKALTDLRHRQRRIEQKLR